MSDLVARVAETGRTGGDRRQADLKQYSLVKSYRLRAAILTYLRG